MNKEVRLRFAKVMIAFSFVIIFIGISFDVKNNVVLDPVKDVQAIAGNNDSSISITTTDGNVPDSQANDNFSSNNGANSGASSNSSSNSSNGSTGNNVQQTNPVAPSTPVVNDYNANLRNTIQSRYGITIKYGSETNGYSVGGLSTISLTDSNEISNALNNLNNTMDLYPSGFFKEMSNYGVPLTVYLIKRYSAGNVTGVTDSSTNNVLISIATDFDFADSFTHESFHYIDHFIYVKGGRYTSWNNLNPGGFIYGNINSNYSYDSTFSEDAFFVNNYAQTDEYEDRSSTFEYMMASSKASCLNYGKNVWLKAKYMAEQMDYFYDSVSPNITEYWERYIY